MELPISTQALLFARGVGLGLGLSAAYDVLRALRRLRPGLTWLTDVLFGLLLGAGLLVFALCAGGGELRLFLFPAIALAAVLYFLTISPFVLRAFQAGFSLIGRLIHIFLAPVRLFLLFLKKF